MKQRILIFVLALIAISTSAAAAYFYSSLGATISDNAQARTRSDAEVFRNRVSDFFSENVKTVKTMAAMKELSQGLQRPDDPTALAQTNSILDLFQGGLGVQVCYLMDGEGNTVASSNRGASDSFVGKNFSFRPYFKNALKGAPSIYMALGTTSKVPGAYCSYPVYKGRDAREQPIGVAVIKSSLDRMEEFIRQLPARINSLVGPHGIVLVSNRHDFLFRPLWDINPQQTAELEKSQQFGKGPWPTLGMRKTGENLVAEPSGNSYYIYQLKLDDFPEWSVVSMMPAVDR